MVPQGRSESRGRHDGLFLWRETRTAHCRQHGGEGDAPGARAGLDTRSNWKMLVDTIANVALTSLTHPLIPNPETVDE